ncbi:glycosyltransferase, partial [Vibrio sp. CAIM 722]
HKDIKFYYAYPPINTEIIEHDKKEERKDRILFFGNFSQAKHKSSNKLISLFCPSMSGFEIAIIIGNGKIDEAIKKDIEDAARVYNIKLKWLFSISDKEKFALYKSSKLLLFPSEFEGFGYPPVEAIYCGCHVVAFDLPVLKETCHDSIHYVKHGDWNEYKNVVSQVVDNIRNNFIEVENENVNSIARLDTFSKEISKILYECNKQKIAYSEDDLKFLWKDKKMSILMKASKFLLVKLNNFFVSKNKKVTYYPRFRSDNDLNNHYFRAAWYLPFKEGVLEYVCFNVAYNNNKPVCNPSMGDYSNNSDHVKIENGKLKFLFSLFSSKVVLVWDSSASNTPIYKLLAVIGVKLINIDTTDLKSKEYGEYPGIMWRHLLTNKQRRDFNQVQVSKFEQIYKEKSNGRKISTVFGTGPSIDLALNYDFSNSITIVCNSIVQDKELISHINPDFITAGDAVSHFGVSSYAKKFRDDMIEVLKLNKNIFYFGTVTFGYIFSVHYPDLIDKMIFISQSLDGPNYNLNTKFEAPKLVSTMNIHMLPLAATFSDCIFILGADGKNPDQSKNEDFWQHSNKAQYTNLVDTGHDCHPTFDIHRQVSTYDDYNKSIENTISNGEKIGKKYYCLSDSYIPYLSKIKITNSDLISYGLIRDSD